MPELPEVESTRRAIASHIIGQRITGVVVRNPRLRLPVPDDLATAATGCRVKAVHRRGKYLLLSCDGGTVLVHLGMSGSLRLLDTPRVAAGRHDHLDILLEDGGGLRLNDPRRFGLVDWIGGGTDPFAHRLLAHLGPEPLSADFSGARLYRRSRGRQLAAKAFIMDARVVVGIGNIYASEALHRAGVHPGRAAGRVGKARYDRLVKAIRQVLQEAIDGGGTTFRDYRGADGQPGGFATRLAVYGREGLGCLRCDRGTIRQRRLAQRATYYCAACQH